MGETLELICRCGKVPDIVVTFKSPKKTIKLCPVCANAHYKSLVKGHNYKLVAIKSQKNAIRKMLRNRY